MFFIATYKLLSKNLDFTPQQIYIVNRNWILNVNTFTIHLNSELQRERERSHDITNAEKRWAIVIMDTEKYIAECERQLIAHGIWAKLVSNWKQSMLYIKS